jgi:hypothetical protein
MGKGMDGGWVRRRKGKVESLEADKPILDLREG